MGPLGCLPRIITRFGRRSSALDELGCVKSHNNAASYFNQQLHDLCMKFQEQFPEANVTYVDIFAIKLDLISNYFQYGTVLQFDQYCLVECEWILMKQMFSGFKEPLAACCGYGGPPLNYDSRISCGETKKLNGKTVTAYSCNNTNEHVNWDGNHYTEAANQHVAEQILTGNYSLKFGFHLDNLGML